MGKTRDKKQAVRARILEQRREVDDTERRVAGIAICRKLMKPELLLDMRIRMVCIYLSNGNEVPTRYIARALWAAEREVCVPVWNRDKRSYDLSIIEPHTHLVAGHYGIREPVVHIPVQPWMVDAFVVPGLAFDVGGGRLGYGAGYYDGILGESRSTAVKIAIGYEWQVQEEALPQSERDVRMGWVVSDKRSVKC